MLSRGERGPSSERGLPSTPGEGRMQRLSSEVPLDQGERGGAKAELALPLNLSTLQNSMQGSRGGGPVKLSWQAPPPQSHA
eukprot:8298953-Karenia_brevis.AAC.1